MKRFITLMCPICTDVALVVGNIFMWGPYHRQEEALEPPLYLYNCPNCKYSEIHTHRLFTVDKS